MADGQSPLGSTGQGFVPVMGNVSNFGFMNNPALMDPGMQQAMARQQYASSLLGLGMETTPLRSPWQAVARAFQGGLGGYEMGESQDLMQQYAEGSRAALAASYAQQPVPQLPQAPPLGGGAAPGPAPAAAPGRTAGGVDPAALVPKVQALQMIAQRESGNNPNAGPPLDANGKPLSTASGAYQILDGTWRDGAALAGVDTAKYPTARSAPADVQYAVASALYDRRGVADWRASANTPLADPNAAPAGGPDTQVQGLREASDAAAQYGIGLAQQYRQMAINAALSPYAAVRAMAPTYQAQSISYAAYGRYTPVGRDPNTGQLLMLDRQGGQVEAVGAPATLHETPQGVMVSSTGRTVIPTPFAPVAGAGPQGGPQGGPTWVGNPAVAHQFGVPTSPGNPYVGQSYPKQQDLLATDRANSSKEAAAGDEEALAARTQLITLGRMQQIAATNPRWLGTGPDAAEARAQAKATNDPLYQEYDNLQKSLIPAERMGAGIPRITNKDMDIFQTMTPSMELSGTALNNSLQSHIRLANLTRQANLFQHDFLNANNTLQGWQSAWDAYLNANPVFTQDPRTGAYTPNQNYQRYQDWFRANTDPNTGLVRLPGETGAAPAQPSSAAPTAQTTPGPQPGTESITTQGDALPDLARYPDLYVIHDPSGKRSFMKQGGTWVPVTVPKR